MGRESEGEVVMLRLEATVKSTEKRKEGSVAKTMLDSVFLHFSPCKFQFLSQKSTGFSHLLHCRPPLRDFFY